MKNLVLVNTVLDILPISIFGICFNLTMYLGGSASKIKYNVS
ncbi:hypothetical protein [Haloimpatiens massiliensis]|nr:hypothetical protein [Haloimpatiens massiliensis]